MYEFHGWARIVHDPRGADDDEQLACLSRVRERVREVADPGLVIETQHNGADFLSWHGEHNHRGDAWPERLLRSIGEAAPGSYGLLYVLDDEDPTNDNRFRVLALRRGDIVEASDELLSPFIPTCEDGFAT